MLGSGKRAIGEMQARGLHDGARKSGRRLRQRMTSSTSPVGEIPFTVS